MNTQIFYLDNGFLIQVWKQVLQKSDDVIISRTYKNSIIDKITLRGSMDSETDMPFFTINNNLEISYSSSVVQTEKTDIENFLRGNGFTIKT
jgi:hypothetical protein